MIFITGDTHIPEDISKLNTKRFPEQKDLSKRDILIICGDFGGVWDGSKEDAYWQKWFDKKNFTTLFVDGNHENFDLLNEFPVVDLYGGKAHKISDSIYHLMRGYVYDIEGKTFFTFGGASSHDKEYRTEGINWWAQEMPTEDEIKRSLDSLEACGWNVDYIITHCAPSSIQEKISSSYEKDELTEHLEYIRSKANYKMWFFGHYHVDVQADEKHRCIFNDIIKL